MTAAEKKFKRSRQTGSGKQLLNGVLDSADKHVGREGSCCSGAVWFVRAAKGALVRHCKCCRGEDEEYLGLVTLDGVRSLPFCCLCALPV